MYFLNKIIDNIKNIIKKEDEDLAKVYREYQEYKDSINHDDCDDFLNGGLDIVHDTTCEHNNNNKEKSNISGDDN